jgi:transcriptional regulator with XRE-family HTH domain
MKEITAPVQITYSFGNFIRTKRIELNLTQQEVADRSGTTQGYLSKIEKGLKEPTLSVALALCDVLKLDINEFAKMYT